MSTTHQDLARSLNALVLACSRASAAVGRRHGLNRNEQLVIAYLAHGVAMAPTDLSREIGMTTAGMTGLLDRLEGDGYLRRERHATDKRRVLLALTKRAVQVHLEMEAVSAAVVRHLETLPSGDRTMIEQFVAAAAELMTTDLPDGSDARRGTSGP